MLRANHPATLGWLVDLEFDGDHGRLPIVAITQGGNRLGAVGFRLDGPDSELAAE